MHALHYITTMVLNRADDISLGARKLGEPGDAGCEDVLHPFKTTAQRKSL